ncbi:MAG: hypothetical protein HYW62_04080 [Candidatus Levybacteria bacterium]|nr:hypothetical protein [Candidatus Levybacteria bacterium]
MSPKRFFKKTQKNTPGKEKKNQSPSNSRTIPAPFKFSFPKFNSALLLKIYRGSLKLFIALIFLLAVVTVGMDLDTNLKAKKSLDLEREKLTSELLFWESVIEERKNYRDAYFQASILQYRLGNTSKAKMYVEKGLSLDPNSKDGRKLEEFLVNK